MSADNSRDYLQAPAEIERNVLRDLRKGRMKIDILDDHASLTAWCNCDVVISNGQVVDRERIAFAPIRDQIEELALRYAVGEIR